LAPSNYQRFVGEKSWSEIQLRASEASATVLIIPCYTLATGEMAMAYGMVVGTAKKNFLSVTPLVPAVAAMHLRSIDNTMVERCHQEVEPNWSFPKFCAVSAVCVNKQFLARTSQV